MKKRRVSNAWLIFGSIIGLIGAAGVISALYCFKVLKTLMSRKSMEGRYRAYYQLAFDWLMKKNEKERLSESLSKYFDDNGIKTIAIYGSGTLGELFYNEIKSMGVKVACFIDRNAEDIYAGIDNTPIVGIDGIESHGKVDAVIVTPIFDFNEINEDLEEAGYNLNIISLADIIYSL